MATRLYLPSSGAAAFDTLAFSAYWDAVEATHYHLASATSKTSTAQAYRSLYIAAGNDEAVFQFITQQFGAFDFTTVQTMKLQMRVLTDSAAASPRIATSVRVVSSDGSAVRGTLYEGYGPTNISQTAWANRSIGSGGAAVNIQNNVSMQNGDRLSIEIGGHVTSTTSIYPYSGDAAASDLPENETSTDAYNPWVEFSGTLPAPGTGAVANIVMNII